MIWCYNFKAQFAPMVEAVRMIRALLDAFTANPERFFESDAKFIAAMYYRTTAYTDGTPVFDGPRLSVIRHLYAEKVKA